MTTYHWYCPECGREEYDYPEEDVAAPRCKSCGEDMCKMEPESQQDKDSGASDEEGQ